MTITQGNPVLIQLNNLIVNDPDAEQVYPNGFSLDINPGKNYRFAENVIFPDDDFTGTLDVRLRVDDGKHKSDWFDFKIVVQPIKNTPPRITAQLPLQVEQGGNLMITLNHLRVWDPDDSYPSDFSLKVFGGNHYSVNGTTITADVDFSGNLKVPVSVSDGESESNRFELIVNVIKTQNISPQITGQVPLSIAQAGSLTILFDHLKVTDPDNSYPTGFALKIFAGENYTVAGNTITPSPNFSGTLKVPVSVNDGKNESNRFELRVDVVTTPNVAPVITGQSTLGMNQDARLTLSLNQLQITDPDSDPADFILKIFPGANYEADGNTIIPSPGFWGTLTVPVSVNDGKNESNRFNLVVNVIKENAAPRITGQRPLQINEDETIILRLSDVTVLDADNTNSQNFVLKIIDGQNYSVSGLTITPAKNFSGTLSVSIRVNDGQSDSDIFDLKITVQEVNDPPMITGQTALTIGKNTVLKLSLSNFTILDPDDKPSEDLTLEIRSGNNYTVITDIVSPKPGFTGLLEVPVVVSDGKTFSQPFTAKITVHATEPNDVPVIVNQKTISIAQNVSITLQLSHLNVNDSDNDYPQGFTLIVLQGNNYTVEGTTVTPKPDMVGLISVPVRVNDGTSDSAPFTLKINVLPPTSKPIVNGQRELTVLEDSTIAITLSDLMVTDTDQPNYPKGFTLLVLSGQTYTKEGNVVRPLRNLNGFIEVGVVVSDGTDFSDEYKVSILVIPVNDPPEIINFDSTALAFEPGEKPIPLFRQFRIRDVDSEQLLMAEIGFEAENYTLSSDQLVVNSDSSKIRIVNDTKGTLFLIGYASIEEYQHALQAIQYNYRITDDDVGNPKEIASGPRTFYVNLFDGLTRSASHQRQIFMEVQVTLDIPNVFTPNGDNSHDTWQLRPTNTDKVDNAVIRVYNRQGLLVYESKGFSSKWDGLHNGQALPVDTYYYTIDLNLPYTKKTYKGTVTLLH